jgi:isocitrate lyase
MGVECIVVGRTDSEAATLLMSNIDGRDHPFILGATNPAVCVSPDCSFRLAKKTCAPLCSLPRSHFRRLPIIICGPVLMRASHWQVGVLNERLAEAAAQGMSEAQITQLTKEWNENAKIMVRTWMGAARVRVPCI